MHVYSHKHAINDMGVAIPILPRLVVIWFFAYRDLVGDMA